MCRVITPHHTVYMFHLYYCTDMPFFTQIPLNSWKYGSNVCGKQPCEGKRQRTEAEAEPTQHLCMFTPGVTVSYCTQFFTSQQAIKEVFDMCSGKSKQQR